MTIEPDDPRIPALQLLLSDLSARDQGEIIRAALSEIEVISISIPTHVGIRLHQAAAVLDEVCKDMDGSSGLGVLAVNNLRPKIRGVEISIRLVMELLRLNPKR